MLRDGEELGRVRVAGVLALLNRGEDPTGWIAHRLTEAEKNEGPEKLASALRVTLEM